MTPTIRSTLILIAILAGAILISWLVGCTHQPPCSDCWKAL
ncbi:hypothetical protein [Rhizobium sp. T136]|nr:hypothetical protein [Rhizobium sp. T136]